MKSTLQITYLHSDPSPALDAFISERVVELHRFYERIERCHVFVESPGRHHRHGDSAQFNVRIELAVPGQRLIVSRHPGRSEGFKDAFVATGNAFHAARRQLQDFAQRQRHDVKSSNRARAPVGA